MLGGAGGGVSTHSRPKAAGYRDLPLLIERLVSTHSRPKAAGQKIAGLNRTSKFQLTAARRRLGPILFMWVVLRCFNSQPPEGGWPVRTTRRNPWEGFNSQPPEGGWQRARAIR